MGRVYYNKLVRDAVRDKIAATGEPCEVREITDEAEFQQELLKKVREEADELSRVRSREAFLHEYTDLMVVLDSLTKVLEISEADLRVAMEENLKQKGWFNNRHFLHWSADSNYESNESPQGLKEQ